MDSIIQRLLSQLTPEQLSQLMAEPEAGRMTNPRLLALMRMTRERSMSDSALPSRELYSSRPGNRGGRGGAGRDPSVPSLMLPQTGIANAYRGQLISPQEALQTPAPDIYVPGAESVRLRGI